MVTLNDVDFIQYSGRVCEKTIGADVELPTPQKLEWGAATAAGIAEANQSGLSWSRGRKRYLGDILATAATVTNEFCLGETQRTISKLISILLEICYRVIVALWRSSSYRIQNHQTIGPVWPPDQ